MSGRKLGNRFKLIQTGAVLIWLASLVIGGYWSLAAGQLEVRILLLLLLLLLFGVGAIYLLHLLRRLELDHRLSMQVLAERALELEKQSARLSAIHKVANVLSEAVELPELLGLGLERAVSALGLDGGQVHLKMDDESQLMRLGAVFGDSVRFVDSDHTVRVGECVCGEAAAGLEPVLVADATTDPRLASQSCAQGGIPCVASVPLKVKNGSLGVLTVRSCDPQNFAIHDVHLLTTVANFLASAIENARIRSGMEGRIAELSAKVQELAIIQERERIGREMHDGLAQTLGLLNMQIEMVKEATQSGNRPVAEAELAQLDDYLGNAYADVRQALSDLRNVQPKGESFLVNLQEVFEQFGRRYDVETVLVAENGVNPICLPALVEVQIQRVIQEALTNVRRHAAAGRVEIRIEQAPDGWQLVVADDGVGFDVEQVREDNSNSYGLLTMQERIESLGGRLGVTSSPGHGTEIIAFVPCQPSRSTNGPFAHPLGR